MTLFRTAAMLTLTACLGACATFPSEEAVWPYPEPPEQGDWGYAPGPESTQDSGATTQDSLYEPPSRDAGREVGPAVSSHPTVKTLVDQADQERAAGELDRAAGTLERAIRIVNNDPLPWVKLAEIRFEQGNFIQAENLARRSLSFASSGPTARDSWLLISDIKRLQGDSMAAENARQQAMQL